MMWREKKRKFQYLRFEIDIVDKFLEKIQIYTYSFNYKFEGLENIHAIVDGTGVKFHKK